ncbi:hypothetical protein NKH16_32480 [Mesorhizobium sp. M1307]|uniref:hypothetical protein n=1 Tax=Mesorhizobium sp. M1307 TaxID=2957079 RepID=UPI00333C1E58
MRRDDGQPGIVRRVLTRLPCGLFQGYRVIVQYVFSVSPHVKPLHNSQALARSLPTETQREAQEALEKQVAQLKPEINKINRTLAERAEEVVQELLARPYS